jgi:heat shock protein HtpX
MTFLKRISLFILTNVLVLVTVGIVFSLVTNFLGISPSNYMAYLIISCLVWGMGGAFVSLFISKWMAKWSMGVQIIDPQTRDPELHQLVETVHALAKRAQLPKMPEVGVFESPEINAFATGPTKSNSLVAVSTGLLHSMSKDELEGVLGHEVAHIANGDMVTMTLIQGVVNAFVMFFSRILSRLIVSQVDERYAGAVQFGLTILFDIAFGILGSLVVNKFSQAREFRADYGGAKFTSKAKMIGALRRLQSQFDHLQPDDGSMATMKISGRSTGLRAMFSTHPTLADRIQALERAPLN